MKLGTVTLRADIAVHDDHDVESHLEHVRKMFANNFSGYVHELYPDAKVEAFVTVAPILAGEHPVSVGLPTGRRIQLRQSLASARAEQKLITLTPDELDELLNGYEHGRFHS